MDLSPLLIYYTDFAIKLGPIEPFLIWGNFLLAAIIGFIFLGVYANALRQERWALHLGMAFSILAVQTAFFQFEILTKLGLLSLLLIVLSAIIPPLAIMVAAKELGPPADTTQKRWRLPFPKFAREKWWGWPFEILANVNLLAVLLAVANPIFVIFSLFSPVHRWVGSVLAIWAYARLAMAIVRNFKTEWVRWLFTSLGWAYGVTFVLKASHPYLAIWQIGGKFGDWLGKSVDYFPMLGSYDLIVLLLMIVLQTLVLLGCLAILIRSIGVLSAHQDLLKDITDENTEVLDEECKGGLLGALGLDLKADFVSLAIQLPGIGKVAWWGWFEQEFRKTLEESDAFKKEVNLNEMPDGYHLHEKIHSPMLLPLPEEDFALVGRVFARGMSFAGDDWRVDHKEYMPLVPRIRSFVMCPIQYQGGVIGSLEIGSRQVGAFTAVSVRRTKHMAKMLAGTVHARRESNALTWLNQKLAIIDTKEEGPFNPIATAVLEIQRTLNPLATGLILNIGFQRQMVAFSQDNERPYRTCISNKEEGDEQMKTFIEKRVGEKDPLFRDNPLVTKAIEDDRDVHIGMMFTICRRIDIHGKPPIARSPLIRRAAAQMLCNIVNKDNEIQVRRALNQLQQGLEGVKEPSTWFEEIRKTVESQGILWAASRLLASQEEDHFGEIEWDKILSSKSFTELSTHIHHAQFQEPYEEAQSCIRIDLPEAKAELWLGLHPKNLEREFKIAHSPWRTFLIELGNIAGRKLAQIYLQRMREVTNQLEVNAQRSVVQNLWMHELGNAANRLSSSAQVTLEMFSDGQLERARKKIGDIRGFTEDFRKIAADLNKPIDLAVELEVYPIRKVLQDVDDYYRVLFESRGIVLKLEGDLDLEVKCPYPLGYLAISNLISNSIKAIRKRGTITISVEALSSSIIHCHVIDDGPGVPEELWEKIFIAGFSTDKRHAGYGLAGTREALRNNDGNLLFEPIEGGAKFTIVFPRSIQITHQENKNEADTGGDDA